MEYILLFNTKDECVNRSYTGIKVLQLSTGTNVLFVNNPTTYVEIVDDEDDIKLQDRPDSNQIYYKTISNTKLEFIPDSSGNEKSLEEINKILGGYFYNTLISNTYENNLGILTFNNDVSIIYGGMLMAIFKSPFTEITDITFSPIVETIQAGGLYNLQNLKVLKIPENCATIQGGAISNCIGLEKIIMPETLVNFDYNFLNQSGIGNLKSLKEIDAYCHVLPSSFAYGATIEKANLKYTQYINNHAFCGCTKLSDINIPDTCKAIGELAFNGCTSLTSIALPKDCSTIKENTFSFCTSLKNVYIPEGYETIGNYAFNGCSSITDINIPDTCKTIGELAFSKTGLTKVRLPKSLKTLSSSAFDSSIISLTNVNAEILNNIPVKCLKVLEITEGCKTLGSLLCMELEHLYLPSTLESLTSLSLNSKKLLSEITFAGTSAKWIKIAPDYEKWLTNDSVGYNVGGFTVHCTDTDLTVVNPS